MILELDCGNSFIKWRMLAPAEAVVTAFGVAGSDAELVAAIEMQGAELDACRLVSVRSDAETRALVEVLERRFSITCHVACSAPMLAGVRNGYEQYQALGLDRWLALVGAFSLGGGACLVLDLGTAVTADLVSSEGEHLGGYICPGMPLLRNQLCTHTRRIRYDEAAAQQAMRSLEPGRSTAEAVERGCALMLQGFVDAQVLTARDCLGEFTVFLTGGDAGLVRQRLPMARVVPDLVFVGLAIACPLS